MCQISVLAPGLQSLLENAVLLLCSLLSPGGRNCNYSQVYSHSGSLWERHRAPANNSKDKALIDEGHKKKVDE